MTDTAHIRNFSIVAHIDHGKSTLADRLIQSTGTVSDRDMKEQLLDSMDIERERGITIKAQTVRLDYTAPGRRDLRPQPHRHPRPRRLRLRGLPLHARRRRLAPRRRRLPGRRGADARQRLPGHRRRPRDRPRPQQDRPPRRRARPRRASRSRTSSASTPPTPSRSPPRPASASPTCSRPSSTASPPPKGDPHAPLKAMLVDCWYDAYLGVVVLVRIFDGILRKGDRIRMMQTGALYGVERLGTFRPGMLPADELGPGEIGFLTASIKQVRDTRVGDTITTERRGTPDAPPRLQARPAGGLLRPLPRRRRRLHRAARRHREAAAQRRQLLLRDGDLRRPRLRLPLRLPRPPPPRGDPRPPRARVRPRPHHHRPLGDLPHPPDRRHACSSCTTPPTCPTRSASTTSRSRASRRPSSSPTTTSATC